MFLWAYQPAACLAIAKASLGEQAYASAWAEGEAMTLEQAIAHTPDEVGA
jgi:hypothetical protein